MIYSDEALESAYAVLALQTPGSLPWQIWNNWIAEYVRKWRETNTLTLVH